MSRQEKLEKARQELEMREAIASVLEMLEERRKWDAMDYNAPDEEHEESYYTVPLVGEYNYTRYMAFCAIIDLVEKKYFG